MIATRDVLERKSGLRRKLLEQRRAAAKSVRSAEAAALSGGLSRWLADRDVDTLCAYVPVRGEPGSLALLDDLRGAGYRVLLPIVVGPQPLEWAEYGGPDTLRSARFGLLEPSGTRLGTEAVAAAGVVLVPALAVDHRGVRLGRGGGHYDRSLPLASASAELIGVVRDEELVAELPAEEHDIRMSAALTPSRGVVRLPL